MGTLRKGNGNETGGVPFIVDTLTASDGGASSGYHPVIPFDRQQITSQHNRSNPQPGDPAYTLNGEGPMIAFEPFSFQTRIARNGRGQPKDVVDCLTSAEAGSHADSKPHVATRAGVRRLTPVECERLQGFPDGWTEFDDAGKRLKDSPRYRMLGNAVSVPVAQWLAERILRYCS